VDKIKSQLASAKKFILKIFNSKKVALKEDWKVVVLSTEWQ
jgi:hypothetical protein